MKLHKISNFCLFKNTHTSKIAITYHSNLFLIARDRHKEYWLQFKDRCDIEYLTNREVFTIVFQK